MFKNILINLMEINNINQRTLSKGADIPTTTISGWLNSDKLPDYTALKKLSLYFDVSADYLIDNNENAERKKRLIEQISPKFKEQTEFNKLAKELAELPPDKQKFLFSNIYNQIENLKKL